MASTIFPDSPGPTQTRDTEVPLWRLYLLRAMFLVFAVGGFLAHLQWLIDPDPTRRGMLDSMLAGLWVLAFFGLRYPLQLLPIFLFEFVWKTIWLVRFGLPQWMAGRSDPQLSEDLILIGLAADRVRAHHPVGLCVAALHQRAGGTMALIIASHWNH